MKYYNYIHTESKNVNRQKRQEIEGCNYIIIPLSMFPLVFAAVLGPTAYELYYLRYATSKNCLQIEIITGKRYATTNRYKQTGSSMYGCNIQQGVFAKYTTYKYVYMCI